MTEFLRSLTPKTRVLLALVLGGIVIFLFWATLFGFLSARQSMRQVNQISVAIGLARQTDSDFQLAVSKGKNFAILKDATNKGRTLEYFRRAKETFGKLSDLEKDPQERQLLYRMEASLHSVEFSLGILTSTGKKSDSAEKLYDRYLKDITIDFDDASQAFVSYLDEKRRAAQGEITSETQMDLLFALIGAFLALAGMGLSYSIARNLNQALHNETASQERYRMLSEVAEEAIMIHDQGIIVEANPAFVRLLGYPLPEILGVNVSQFMDRSSARVTEERIQKGYPDNSYELWARRKDGTTFPMLIHGRDIQYQGRQMRLSCGWDLTEIKKSEEALQDSQERFERFAEVTKEGIMIHENGIIVDVNQALVEMTGMARGELVGTNGLESLTFESQKALQEYQKTGYPERPYELTLQRKDGTLMPVEIHGLPFEFEGRTLRVARFWDLTERKKAEETIRDSEEKFRNLIENSHDLIAVTDADRVITYISPSVKRILGYEPSERLGQTFAPIMHPDDLPKIRTIFAQFVQTQGTLVMAEFRLLHKDGSWRSIESTGINLLKNPSVEAIVYNMRDITERKMAEEALRQSEENFRNLIEKSPDAILVHREGKIVYVNSRILSLLGYEDKEELLGKPGTYIVHPEDQPIVSQRIQTLSHGGKTYPMEMRLIRQDKALIPAEAASISILFEGIPGIMVSLRDITSRKQAEAVARENQERYRSLVDSMPDAVLVHDEENVLYLNPSGLNMFGAKSQEDFQGRSFWEMIPSEARAGVRERIMGTIERGTFNPPAERRLLKLDGSTLEALVTSVPFLAGGRRVVLAILSDITARKDAERKAQKYQRLAALGELAAGLAHEIRNPAAAISAQAQYLMKKTEKGTTTFDQLKDIVAQCDRLDTLVHDTLDYSPEKRFEERTEIPAKDLLQKILWLAQTQFGPSHARVQVILDTQPDLPPLKIHPTRMERVLVNLVLNAFQAMPPEGGHLLLKAYRHENKAIIRVEDDGKGITDQEMSRLFEPFFTSRKMGSGLGLSICQKIVEEHGGQIRVERLEPHGAAFTIEIPLQS